MSSVVEETPGQRARAALDRHAWGEAYEVMAQADHAGGLAPEDLEVLAQSAWWVGQQDVARDAWERAYTLHAKAGDKLAAASAAAQLAFNLLGAGLPSVLNGWVNRAERLLQGAPEQPVHALLAVVRGMMAFTAGDLDIAAAAGRRALELGTAFGIPDLQAMGLHLEGRALVAKGRVEEGMALLDEATAAAVSGELSPQVTGRVYCSTVSACWGVADYRRAGEWADAAERWCRRRSINGFPGVCRLHKAQIHKLRGMWREAEAEALLACKELPSWFPLDLGRALSEIGEIRLRTGDLEGAEEAFLQANDAGHDPNPGLALLQLAEGDVQAAAATIRDALDNPQAGSFETPPNSDLQRASLLPAQVEISLAAGDVDAARAGAVDLDQIAETTGVAAMRASAAWARGLLQLAEGQAEAAQQSFRGSAALWAELDAPYETARARMGLADAYRAAGNEGRAVLEYRAALASFDRLGAAPDARRATEALGEAVGRPAPRQVERTFMFTDIVRSTNLVEALGDEAWGHLIRWHDEQLRSQFAAHGGEVVKAIGDGFFVAFQGPGDALACAVAIQRALAEHRRAHGFAPQVRIGVHAASATHEGLDYRGRGVNAAARVGALADGGEILATAQTAALAPTQPATGLRSVMLKGFADPVEVVSIEWS
ncbi:MAG TPA: adenylate/guanylate cyclase domain-containing protein [Actinomycetota bacterium]|nr:adenylate/guanylate cyclase domain-containing protein [Actinomycetota bacterium]